VVAGAHQHVRQSVAGPVGRSASGVGAFGTVRCVLSGGASTGPVPLPAGFTHTDLVPEPPRNSGCLPAAGPVVDRRHPARQGLTAGPGCVPTGGSGACWASTAGSRARPPAAAAVAAVSGHAGAHACTPRLLPNDSWGGGRWAAAAAAAATATRNPQRRGNPLTPPRQRRRFSRLATPDGRHSVAQTPGRRSPLSAPAPARGTCLCGGWNGRTHGRGAWVRRGTPPPAPHRSLSPLSPFRRRALLSGEGYEARRGAAAPPRLGRTLSGSRLRAPRCRWFGGHTPRVPRPPGRSGRGGGGLYATAGGT